MQIQEYLSQEKKIYNSILTILQSKEDDNDDLYQILYHDIDAQNIANDKDEFTELLHILASISINCKRTPRLTFSICTILQHYIDQIKQLFSNFELFNFFKHDKLILLSLFDNKIITVDENISNFIIEKSGVNQQLKQAEVKDEEEEENYEEDFDEKQNSYLHYEKFFYPEIKSFLSEDQKQLIEKQLFEINSQIFDQFDQKRKTGENDSHICELIREDSIEEFIVYVNKDCYPLTITINHSIFETNRFLLKRTTSLIEYAAFFGSIQILQYLKNYGVDLEPSIWPYAIQSGSAVVISFIESENIQPPNKSYLKVLKECIQCHSIDNYNYILNNYLNESDDVFNVEKDFNENILSYAFHYHNYDLIPDLMKKKYAFFYLCQYNYIKLVKLYLENENFDVNSRII